MTKTVTLGEICKKIISGGTPSTENTEFWGGSIPWITSADIKDHYTVNARKFLTEKAGVDILPAGNILVVTRVGLGKLVVNQVPLAFSQDLQGLILKPNVDRNYLVYALSQKVLRFKEIGRGATIKGVTRSDLVNIPIPLPPLPRQRQIAAILDRADALRQKDRQLLAYYDKLAQSLFMDLFGDYILNGTVSLDEVVEVNPKRSAAKLSDDLEVSFVPMNCVGEKGEFDSSHMRKLKDVKIGFTYFSEGDVLFAKITPCMENGKGAIAKNLLNGVGFGSTEFHVLRPTKLARPDFIYFLLAQKNLRQFARSNMSGSAGQQRVPTNFFNKVKISVPPLPLQTHFATIIEGIERQKALVRQQITASEQLFQRLLQDAFGG